MALQSLLEALARRTADEIAAVRDSARAEAAALLRVADDRASNRRTTALRERERALRDEAERAVVATRREARRMELEARQRLLERVLAATRERLPAAGRDPAFHAAVPAKLTAAFDSLGDIPAVIHAAANLADMLRPLARQRDHVALAIDPDVRTGFRLESADARVTIDATLEGHLERERHAILLVALAALREGA